MSDAENRVSELVAELDRSLIAAKAAAATKRLFNALGLHFWGSDCSACEGNATCGSMVCDWCGSEEHTVALYAYGGEEP